MLHFLSPDGDVLLPLVYFMALLITFLNCQEKVYVKKKDGCVIVGYNMLSQGMTRWESLLVMGRRPVDSKQMPDEESASHFLDAFQKFGTSPRVSKATETRLPRFATPNYAKGINISAGAQ